MQGRTLICLLSLQALVLFGGEPMVTTSPDGKLEIALTCNEKGQLSYTFRAEGTELIKASRAGYDLGVLSGTTRSSENTLWKPIWGKRATVPEQYNELTLDMKSYQMVILPCMRPFWRRANPLFWDPKKGRRGSTRPASQQNPGR